LESLELIAKWGKKGKFRKCWDERLNPSILKAVRKYVRPRILPFETIGFGLLIIGLGLEYLGGKGAELVQLKENAGLETNNWALQFQVQTMSNSVAQANARAADAVRDAFKLRVQLANAQRDLNESILQLRDATSPMDIGDEYSFAQSLTPAGIDIELRSSVDANAQHTADSLQAVFFLAHWPVINRGFIGNIGYDGVVVGCNGDAASDKASHLLMRVLLDRGIPTRFTIFTRNVPTNTVIIAVMRRPDNTNANFIIADSMSELLGMKKSEVLSEIVELGQKRFIVPSKEYNEAVVVYTNLEKQFADLDASENAWNQKRDDLEEQIRRVEEGTNFDKPGIHSWDDTFIGVPLPYGVSSNSNIFIRDVHVNPVPLQ
jgi:hypothetical protein